MTTKERIIRLEDAVKDLLLMLEDNVDSQYKHNINNLYDQLEEKEND